MLRQISSFDPDEYLLSAGREHHLLNMLRLAISVFSGINLEKRIYSAPYEPSDRPETHYLKHYRSFAVFDLSCASGKPDFTFHDGPNRSFGFEHSTEEVFEDQLFVHEVFEVGKSVSLFNKSTADDRAKLLLNQPLWRGFSGTEQTVCISVIETLERDQPDAWSFWLEWYLGLVTGHPIDRELQRRVALIENAIWKAGPEAVAKEIEHIQSKYLAEKLPLAETIDLNPDTGKFYATPVPVHNAPLMSALLTRISDDLEDAMVGHNGLTERSGDVRKITRVVTRYGNDPQQTELTLTTVAKSLRRQIHDSHELPDSPDNLALLESVEDGVRGIRANHPDVAANRNQLAQQAVLGLEPEEKQVLEQALPVLTALSEGALAEDFAEDIPELINDALLPLPDGAPALPPADAATRVFGRAAKMSALIVQGKKLTEKSARAFDSNLVKTIRLAGLAVAIGGGVAGFLYTIVQIGLRIFGVL